jgi:hypothetical protein
LGARTGVTRRKLRGLIGLYPLPCRELGIADG